MKTFVAPPASVGIELCSAAISHKRTKAAAECSTGMDTRASTDETIWASRKVQVPLPTKRNKNP